MRRPGPLLVAVALATAQLVLLAAPAGGQTEGTPGLSEARRKADRAAGEINELQSRLGQLEADIRRSEAEAGDAQAEHDRLRDQVRSVAVQRYTEVGELRPLALAQIDEQARAKAMLAAVTGERVDAIDAFRATRQRLDRSLEVLAGRRAEQENALAQLEAARARLDAELARLEQAERARLAEEQRRREEAARAEAQRQAEEAARRQAEQARTTRTTGRPTTSTTRPTSPTSPTTTTPPRQIGTGPWICPVQGPRSFIDSWGFPRPGGRAHQGVDIMSPRGTPVVLPVGGRVTFRSGGLGGLSFRLEGDDGNYYYGAHLDGFADVAPGHHPAGTVVGYVGDTGDAKGAGTHLHFEIHLGGYGNPINPYPTTARHC